MKNFQFEYEGKKYWYSRSVATTTLVLAHDKNMNKYVLAIKRGSGSPDYVGYWCLPCGYLDFDETVKQCAAREVMEESGLPLDENELELIEVHSDLSGNQNVTIRFRCRLLKNIESISLTNEFSEENEIANVKWIDIKDVDKYNWAFGHLGLIKYFSVDVL